MHGYVPRASPEARLNAAAILEVTGPPYMPDDRELWACALQVERQHGKEAPRFVAQRIGALAELGDEAGIAAWKMIAERLDKLMRAGDGCGIS